MSEFLSGLDKSLGAYVDGAEPDVYGVTPEKLSYGIPQPTEQNMERMLPRGAPKISRGVPQAVPYASAPAEEENSWLGNEGRGLLERGADLAGNFVGGIDTSTGMVGEALGIDGSRDAGFLRKTAESIKGFDAGYDESQSTSIDQVLEDDIGSLKTAGRAVGFAVGTFIRSVPDLAAMINPVAAAAYFGSRTEEIAQERATNDGREGSPDLSDVGIGMTTAAVVGSSSP